MFLVFSYCDMIFGIFLWSTPLSIPPRISRHRQQPFLISLLPLLLFTHLPASENLSKILISIVLFSWFLSYVCFMCLSTSAVHISIDEKKMSTFFGLEIQCHYFPIVIVSEDQMILISNWKCGENFQISSPLFTNFLHLRTLWIEEIHWLKTN